MKTLNLLTLCFIVLFAACTGAKKDQESGDEMEQDTTATDSMTVSLVKMWETDTVLTTVESVIFDEERNTLYTANIAGTPDEKDGVGFISKVDLEGNVVEEKWISGLDAPKGMAIMDGKLYVSDIDIIREIDIETGELINSYEVEGAIFLNDVDAANGIVYVSDTDGSNIVALEDGKVSVVMDSMIVNTPNGLFITDGTMLTAFWENKEVKIIDLSTKEIKDFASGLENPDGIEAVGNGGFLVSNWAGQVHYVSPEGETTLILDTTSDEISAADIEFIPSKKMLLVPTFFSNKVVAYELKM